jgi:transcriptional regulator with XRE-family HTH domain
MTTILDTYVLVRILRELRLSADINQVAFAKRLGKFPHRLSELEHNKRKLTLETLANYCDILILKISDVFLIYEHIIEDIKRLESYEVKYNLDELIANTVPAYYCINSGKFINKENKDD